VARLVPRTRRAAGQQLADQIIDWKWSDIRNRLARRVNPLLAGLLRPMTYRWAIDQCE
jgi:hypothetical protein